VVELQIFERLVSFWGSVSPKWYDTEKAHQGKARL